MTTNSKSKSINLKQGLVNRYICKSTKSKGPPKNFFKGFILNMKKGQEQRKPRTRNVHGSMLPVTNTSFYKVDSIMSKMTEINSARNRNIKLLGYSMGKRKSFFDESDEQTKVTNSSSSRMNNINTESLGSYCKIRKNRFTQFLSSSSEKTKGFNHSVDNHIHDNMKVTKFSNDDEEEECFGGPEEIHIMFVKTYNKSKRIMASISKRLKVEEEIKIGDDIPCCNSSSFNFLY